MLTEENDPRLGNQQQQCRTSQNTDRELSDSSQTPTSSKWNNGNDCHQLPLHRLAPSNQQRQDHYDVEDPFNATMYHLKDEDDKESELLEVCFGKLQLQTVLMYFENKRCSGSASVIIHHELVQPGKVLIEFEQEGVAEHVCARPHKLEGKTLEVTLIEELGPAENTIEVTEFTSSIGEEALELYFENKRSGGGEIIESKMNEDRSKFTVTFENEEVVHRILAHDHVLSGTFLNVQRPKKMWQYKQVDKSEVEVHGDTSTDLLEMYFESRTKSGGGGNEVNVVFHENKQIWTVKFDNVEIADRVLKKSHRLNNKDIKVSRPEPKRIVACKSPSSDTDGKEEEEDIPLVVENVNTCISEEHLKLYFESHEKSGGGPIVLMQKNQKVDGNWTIHFQKPGVAQAVVGQKFHELGGSRLNVKLGMRCAKRPLIDRCLLISDLPRKLNLEIFQLYLEKVSRKNKPIIKFGRDPTKAMVEYTDSIKDIDEVISRIEKQKLQNTKINAKKVFEADKIIVQNLDKNFTEEMLKLYFENYGRSSGGPINDMQLDDKRLAVTIQFGNYTVVKSVLRKKHHLQKKELEVCLYYDEIGALVSDGHRWTPDPIPIPVDPELLNFVLMTPTFNDNMSHAGIEIEHNPDDPGIFKLHAAECLDLNGTHDWEDHAASNYKQFFTDTFDKRTLEIGDECFEEFQKYLETVDTEGVELLPDDSSPSLMILGLKDAVKIVWDRLSHQLKIMNDEIERKKNITKKTKTFKPIKIKQIHLLRFGEAAMSNYGVKMVVDDHNNMVSFEGLLDDINSAMLDLYKELENFAEVSFLLDAEICKFLTDFYDKIISVLENYNHHITYEIYGNRVTIYSTSDGDATTAKSRIEEIITHHKYPLPNDKLKVMMSTDGQKLLDDLNSPNIVTVEMKVSQEVSCISITGINIPVQEAISQIDHFLITNQILEKKMSVEREVIRLFEKHHSEELFAVESALNMYFVKFKPNEADSCIFIRGNCTGIVEATKKINDMKSKVRSGKHLLSQQGMANFFKEEKGRLALESVENTCTCVIEFSGRDTSTAAMEILLRHKIQNGIELIVCKADMTQMKVDVIVNAANEKLQHAGGLAKAIVDAGGKEIQEESKIIMAARNGVPIASGEAIVTAAGSLPCKKVIHTVGPKYSDHPKTRSKRLLMEAVTCAYEEAEKLGLASIGMPAISSGIYGYPLTPCTQTILEATKEYFNENPRSKIQQVYFLSIMMNVCKEFEASMRMAFKINQVDNVAVAIDNNYVDDEYLAEVTAMQTSRNPGLTINNEVLTTREGFHISLVKGKIQDSWVDVIVNTTTPDLNLNTGGVSSALLKAAGSQLQQECYQCKSTRGNIRLTHIVETGPAALNCQKVFHTSSRPYKGPSSMQDIRKLLKNIFSSASKMKSIAIPALGTGNLKYPADEVAKIMYEEAIAFSSKHHSHSSLRDIKFVVFLKDSKTLQAFENELKNLKKAGKKLKNSPKLLRAKDAVGHREKRFRKVSELCAEMKIAGITVTILQGDLTHNDADAIVNITTEDFDLNCGAVSKAILRAGGRSIQTECLNNMKPSQYEVWTGPGTLPCSGICHVPNTGNLKSIIVNRVLRTVDVSGRSSLAFPAIGTGAASKTPRESAMFILDCIGSFAIKYKPTNLRDIRIVVFEEAMTREFISVMEETERKPFQQRNLLQKGWAAVKSWWEREEEITNDSHINPAVTLRILALHEDQIQDAKGRIQTIISQETKEKAIHNEVFSRFARRHFMELKEIGVKHGVKIDMTKVRANVVKLHGRTTSVMDAHGGIVELINKFHEEEMEHKENEFILKEVKWYYESDAKEMIEFDEEIVILLEKAYKKKKRTVKYTTTKNFTYEVDFKYMEERNLSSNRTNAVERKDLTVGQNFPSTWLTMGSSEKLKVVDLSQGTEYQNIKQQFIASLSGQNTHIHKISRIQNIELWKQYAAKKEAFEKAIPGKQVEQILYHGTDESTVKNINQTGFNRSYAGKNATAYGMGTYFAVTAGYSASNQYSRPNIQGQKHIFLCHVLVGRYTQGKPGLLAPPPLQPNSTDLYNSVVDNVANPGMFVIFNDVQAYPSYLITFT
ncbi:protein mono-ADP-ribosyltransferase PARP14-like [Anneissia japonica]|uniref:protein mono-ADP-ribosyltransferase PARP14-like n=1 Tax=Anneissia japonica TaxID=1529436 RepID=UPI00142571F5|nr:protein mono-ADP-ribosyltransferase PARP14-like [Anneissia japonica]